MPAGKGPRQEPSLYPGAVHFWLPLPALGYSRKSWRWSQGKFMHPCAGKWGAQKWERL